MELFDLAARQHGVFSRAQADGLGHGPAQRRTWLTNGIITRHHPGVYRLTGAPSSWRQRVHAAVLWLPDSLASHRTAAALHELRGCERAPVELVVERWTRRHRPPEILVHETKDLVAGDIGAIDGIPCTTLVRTLVDLPAVTHDQRVGDALDGATRYDPTVLDRVRRRHREVARRGRNGTTRLRRVLAARLDGEQVDSGFERLALDLIATASLPRPVTQHQIRDGDFTCYLDLAWPDRRIAMECDSVEHHLNLTAFQWERDRRRHLIALGWTVLEFTWVDVTQRGGMVLQTLAFHLTHPQAA